MSERRGGVGTFQSWPCRYCGERLIKRPDRQSGESEYTHFSGGVSADLVCAGDHIGREPLPEHDRNDDWVCAVEVRSGEPQFVADSLEEVEEMVGDWWGGEQCDNCGNSAYKITRGIGGLYVMRCTVNPDDEVSSQFGGCATEWPIRLMQVREVAMP